MTTKHFLDVIQVLQTSTQQSVWRPVRRICLQQRKEKQAEFWVPERIIILFITMQREASRV